MKVWSTDGPGRNDLTTDDMVVPPLTITEQYRAMKRIYKTAPPAQVNEILMQLGLRHE